MFMINKNRPKFNKSVYEDYSSEQMNNMLPKDTNWTFIRHDGYEIVRGVRNLVVIVECNCGNQLRKKWFQIKNGTIKSCGCLLSKDGIKFKNNTSFIDGEIWKELEGYGNFYEISNHGRIKIKDKIDHPFDDNGNKMIKTEGKFLSLRPNINSGYIHCMLFGRKNVRVHRLVAKTFIPNPENKLRVNHKNGIKADNRDENLEWCTDSENLKHAYDTGLLVSARGEKHGNSKLTEIEVLEIRAKYIPFEYSMKRLSKEYGVCEYCINAIINKKH